MEKTNAVTGGRALPAFCGLGLPVDAAVFRAARLDRSLMKAPASASRPLPPVPARPWGFELLVTLGRQTRAG